MNTYHTTHLHKLHPGAVLYDSGKHGGLQSPALPCVDHYAGSEKLMLKALALQNASDYAQFDITFDCEDGATVGHEAQHRDLVATLLMSDDNRFQRIGVRIHDLSHAHWLADLRTLVRHAGQRLAFITLPKARSAADVRLALKALREAESSTQLARRIPLHVLIETHQALHEIWQIAALPGVASLDFGLMDFVSAHHGALPAAAMHSPLQFDHPLLRRAKSDIAAAALAHGITPTHNVCTELHDTAQIFNDALRARTEFGFLRMWSIHPAQIEPILRAMQPTSTDVVTASELLLAAQDAQWGPTQYAGRLHDRASYRFYWQVLQRAHATGCSLSPETRTRFFNPEYCNP